MVNKDKEYNLKILINIELVTSCYAKDNEELKDKAFDFLNNMEPLKAHYILQCGRRTVLKSEDGMTYEKLSLNKKEL